MNFPLPDGPPQSHCSLETSMSSRQEYYKNAVSFTLEQKLEVVQWDPSDDQSEVEVVLSLICGWNAMSNQCPYHLLRHARLWLSCCWAVELLLWLSTISIRPAFSWKQPEPKTRCRHLQVVKKTTAATPKAYLQTVWELESYYVRKCIALCLCVFVCG